MDLQAFLGLLQGASGPNDSGEYLCQCPAHDDSTASLCVKQGDKGIVVCCQAGCRTQDVMAALGLEMKDLFPANAKPAGAKVTNIATKAKKNTLGDLVAVYAYQDEEGKTLFEVCRFERLDGEKRKKAFLQRVYRPDAPNAKRDGYVYRNDARKVLYKLPEVIKAIAEGAPIYLVEGEKDADNLQKLGFATTTNPGGASGKGRIKWLDDYTQQLAGADVIILPDNDGPGRYDREQVAAKLVKVCKRVRLVDLKTGCPELPDKGDITDFLKLLGRQKGLETLQQLIDSTPAMEAPEGTKDRDAAAEYYNNIPGYCVDQGCICQWVEEVPRRLATFVALPRAVITRDDGVNVEKIMVIDGWNQEGRALQQVRVATKNYKSMNWVLENWDFDANILPGNAVMDKLRYVMQEVGKTTARRSTEYSHTGWRKMGGQWAFLYQGGAIGAGDVSVDLGSGLQGYRLDGEGQASFQDIPLLEAMETSFLLRTCMAAHVAIPLQCIAYLAPLREPLAQMGFSPAFSTFLVGETGSGKSTAAALALSHFGSFTAKSLPASFHDTSNYIQKKAFLLKDMVMVVDDYHPTTSLQERRRMENTAQNLSRTFGDNASRGRMNSDTSLREANPPRCISIISGEDMPDVGSSGIARYYVVNVETEDVPKNEVLTYMQDRAQQGYFARSMRGYIEWLIPQMDQLPVALASRFKELRTKAQSEVQGHARTPEAVAHLMLGYEMMTRYMHETGFMDAGTMDTCRAEAWDIITAISDAQGKEAKEERPSRVFLRTLSEMLVSGRVTVSNLADPQRTAGAVPINMVGYMDQEHYYLLPDVTFSAVAEHTRKKGQELPLSHKRLFKQMRTDNLLIIDGKAGKTLRNKRIDGRVQRYLWVPRRLIDGKMAEQGQQVEIEGVQGTFTELEGGTPFDGKE